ncbi:MAG: outer membrane protein assembly factor BamE [Rhodocyclaceae bacterium]
MNLIATFAVTYPQPRVYSLRMNFLRYFSAVLAMVLLGACSSVPRIVSEYRIDVQQGNVLTQDMVAQLRPGLTRDQVRFLLGTPLLVDMFHADRWDYVYRLQKGATQAVETRRFTVFFDPEGKLYRVAGDVVADSGAGQEAAPDVKSRVIDLGSADTAAPPVEEKGFFGSMMEKVGF